MPAGQGFTELHKNRHFIVVNKMPGVVTQGAEAGTNLLAQVKAVYGLAEVYPVHRLDAPTSGLVLLALTADASRELSVLFAEGLIDKYYLALSTKKPKKKQGLIKGDMVKARNGAWRLTKDSTQPAVTRFVSYGAQDKPRLFVVKPLTGKTHQIRVALKAVGAPVLGDKKYGGEDADRMYLHAYMLKFVFNGEPFRFCVLPPSGEHFKTDELTARLPSDDDLVQLFSQ